MTETVIEAPAMRHPVCRHVRCQVCLEDHLTLGRYFDGQCGTSNRVDHLGRYHSWLTRNGHQAETEFGWGHPDTFKAENIQAYIEEYGRRA